MDFAEDVSSLSKRQTYELFTARILSTCSPLRDVPRQFMICFMSIDFRIECIARMIEVALYFFGKLGSGKGFKYS